MYVCIMYLICLPICALVFGSMSICSTRAFFGGQSFPSKQTTKQSPKAAIVAIFWNKSSLIYESIHQWLPHCRIIPAPERTRYRCQPKKPKRTMPMMQHSTQMKTTMPWWAIWQSWSLEAIHCYPVFHEKYQKPVVTPDTMGKSL